jgi:hypothetical protein
MVQESIVEYINAQMKLGVTRDAIKATLTGAGWQAADVEDTLKKIEVTKTTAQPMAVSAVRPADSAVTSKLITPAGGPANPEPQTIKVSDLISSSPSISSTAAASTMPAAKPAGPKSPLTGPAPAKASTPSTGTKTPNTFQASSYPGMKTHGSRGALVTEIVLAVIIVAIGAFAGFLYTQNGTLKNQLNALSGQSSGVNSQLSALQTQVAASTTALTAQVATLTTKTQELQTEISFYSAPFNSVLGATTTASVSGVVSGGGKVPYLITATYGAKVYVANSKVAGVITALTPLMGTASTTASTAQFSGSYIPGSDNITLTAVNGTPVQ